MHLVWCRTKPVLQKQPSTQSFFSQSCLEIVMPDDVVAYRQPSTHFEPQSWYTSFSGSSHKILCSSQSNKYFNIIHIKFCFLAKSKNGHKTVYLDRHNRVGFEMDANLTVQMGMGTLTVTITFSFHLIQTLVFSFVEVEHFLDTSHSQSTQLNPLPMTFVLRRHL